MIGKEAIAAKLEAAEVNILMNNLAMTKGMLEMVKAEVVPQIPIGPGHFGYHARDTFRIELRQGAGQLGTKVTGLLKAAVEAYWREFGTGLRYRGHTARLRKQAAVRIMTGTTGGEPAHLTATHALAGIKKYIKLYYGGMARWWHAPKF